MRGASSVIAFVLAILLFDDVLIAVALMGVVCSLEVWFYDVKVTRQFGSIKPLFNKKIVF